MAQIEYQFFGDFSDLSKLEPIWKAVEAPHVFQSYEVVNSWFSITKHCELPAIVVGYDRGAPFAILPACVMKWNQTRMLSWAPGRLILDYGDILFNPHA